MYDLGPNEWAEAVYPVGRDWVSALLPRIEEGAIREGRGIGKTVRELKYCCRGRPGVWWCRGWWPMVMD